MLTFIGWLVLLIFLGILFVALLAVTVLSPVLPSMILRASCSVADVKEPRYLLSFPLGYGVVAFYGLLCGLFVYLLGRLDQDPEAPFGSMHLCGYLLALALGWIVAVLALSSCPRPVVPQGVLGGRVAALAPRPGRDPGGGPGADRPFRLATAAVPDARLQRPAAPGHGPRHARRLPAVMILEGIVTTVSAAGQVHIAPMGPRLLGDPYAEARRFVLRPFRTAQTCANLRAHGEGVLHVTDDVLLLARAAVGELDPLPAHQPAVRVRGWVLPDACRWYEFRVTSCDDRSERVAFEAEVVHAERRRDFFGFNRAMYAVVEAAILATRVALLPRDEIEADFRKLAVLVEKTGGPREVEAFAFLQEYLRKVGSRQ